MAIEFEVTKDTSGLIEATGFWSGDTVYFNPDPTKIIVIDQALEVMDLKPLVDQVLKDRLQDDIERMLGSIGLKRGTSLIERIRKSSFGALINLNLVPAFDRDQFKGRFKTEWSRVAKWLADNYYSEDEQRAALANILAESVRANPNIVRFDKAYSVLWQLLHPWLRETLQDWSDKCVELSRSLQTLATFAISHKFLIKRESNGFVSAFNLDVGPILNSLRAAGARIPPIDTVMSLNIFSSFMCASAQLIGALAVQRKILLPATIEPRRVMGIYHERGPWLAHRTSYTSDIQFANVGTFILRLLACSTLQSVADVPENLGKIAGFVPNCNNLNASMVPLLRAYAEQEVGRAPFPLTTLNRRKGSRNSKAVSYSITWLKEKSVPKAWQKFAELLRASSNAGDKRVQDQTRTVLDWAFFERGFESPNAVTAMDLRDQHHPTRDDTFYYHVKNLSVEKKWPVWNSAEYAFRVVYNASQRAAIGDRLLTSNPFEFQTNPFTIMVTSATHRHRIPNNVHEAMLNVLLSPDENGNPTYSFVRDTLKMDWFNLTNPETGKVEREWCPSRAHLLTLLMVLPIRGKQGRWLDQGLMDDQIWDMVTNQYVENTHPLRNWRYPNGQTHLQMYGRPSGALQPIQDSLLSKAQLCIFINTNKTQMWDPEKTTGYEIWWPRGDELRDIDIATLAKQAAHLDRPYTILEAQRQWMMRCDPHPAPVTFMDDSAAAQLMNADMAEHYPYFTPLFRDLCSPYHHEDGTAIFLPVTRAKLDKLYDALAYHTQKRLREQGLDVVLSVPHNYPKTSYKGTKCRYDLHSLRVFGVSYLVELGIPFHIVQLIVGHMTAAMTIHYNKTTAEFMRQIITEKVGASDILGDWDHIAADILSERRGFVTTNAAFAGDVPKDLLDADYTGFVQKPGGMCPMGGTACEIGQVTEDQAVNGKTKTTYGPVNGGCGNCRFFCTTPAHLFQHTMVVNDLMIRVRSLGKQQVALASRLGELSWQDANTRSVAVESENLKSQIEDGERQLEPLVREWINRARMIETVRGHLDDYIEYLKTRPSSSGAMVVASPSSVNDLRSHIQVRLEQTGEFELAHQTLRAAHLQGDIEQCSELSRKQMCEFMDRIMVHEDARYLLLRIHDEETRDKVAFLMSEAMASMAGGEAVQKALDNNTGLTMPEDNKTDFLSFMKGLFRNANELGKKAEMSSLLPPQLHIVEGGRERDQ